MIRHIEKRQEKLYNVVSEVYIMDNNKNLDLIVFLHLSFNEEIVESPNLKSVYIILSVYTDVSYLFYNTDNLQ